MSLKTSFFDKSLFKSDLKRFWWIGLLETLILAAATTLPVYNNCKRAVGFEGSSWNCAPTWETGGLPIIILFSIGVGIILFSYLHFSASVSFHHSVPVKRKTVYLTKLLSAFVLTLAPVLINALIFAIMSFDSLFLEFFTLKDVVLWAIAGLLYTSVLLSLTMAVNMMTGNPIGTLVFTAGFAFLPLIFTGFFQSFFDIELYGYAYPVTNSFIEHIYIDEDNIFKASYFFIYPAMSVIFWYLGYLFYRHRKLENHGEVIAYNWLKPVFIAIIAILSSMLSYLYFYGIFNLVVIWQLLPIGLIGTVIAWMISRKSLSLKGVMKPIIIYLSAAVVFCLVIEFDLTGFVKRVPESDKIASASIVSENIHYRNGVEIMEGEGADFTKESDIRNVIELHKYLIETKDSVYRRIYTIPIEYTLKNGKVLRRQYSISYIDDAEYLKPLYETEQIKAYKFPVVDKRGKNYVYMNISDRRVINREIYPDNADMTKLIEALKKDIAELEYDEIMINNGGSTVIEHRYNLDSSEEGYMSDSYFINHNYTNTEKVLQEMGFYKNLPAKFDFQSASVSVWDSMDYEAEQKVRENPTVITDIDEIATLYSFYDSMIDDKKFTSPECKNICIEYKLKSGHTFEVSCSYDADKIPAELKKYFN